MWHVHFFAQFLGTNDVDSKTIRQLSFIQITSELERIDSFIYYEELRTAMVGKPEHLNELEFVETVIFDLKNGFGKKMPKRQENKKINQAIKNHI